MTAPLSPAERERFDALAPYVDAPSMAPADASWLAACAARDSALADELATHRALRQGFRRAWADQPQDRGLAKALARLGEVRVGHNGTDALTLVPTPEPKSEPTAAADAGTTSPSRPGALANPAAPRRRAGAWWALPVPAWVLAGGLGLACLALPWVYQQGLGAGQGRADANVSRTRGPAVGLFDGPLIRLNLQPQMTETALRQLLVGQAALAVGPTRLGDWYVKVAPARVSVVRAALLAAPGVASADVVDALPPELVQAP